MNSGGAQQIMHCRTVTSLTPQQSALVCIHDAVAQHDLVVDDIGERRHVY